MQTSLNEGIGGSTRPKDRVNTGWLLRKTLIYPWYLLPTHITSVVWGENRRVCRIGYQGENLGSFVVGHPQWSHLTHQVINWKLGYFLCGIQYDIEVNLMLDWIVNIRLHLKKARFYTWILMLCNLNRARIWMRGII